MSTLIKIDRNSIKKNKNAGSCTSHFFGEQVTEFKTICTTNELEQLESKTGIHVLTIKTKPDNLVEVTGSLLHLDFHKELVGKYEVESNNNIQTVNHFPIPQYSYEFENTPIECEECKNLIQRNEIEHDSYYTEDDDIDYEICPICKAHDSFEYEFESINDALK